MSKIYEALQQANGKKVQASLPVPAPGVSKMNGLVMKDEMFGLYKMLEALLPDMKSRVIQFISTREGEGTSTIVREFSKLAAEQIGHSVLLLEADRYRPTQNQYFKMQYDCGWTEALQRGEEIGSAVHQVGDSSLYVSFSCSDEGATPELFNSPVFDNLCNILRNEFDLVIIDSAPFSSSPDGLAIASKVDGVVLILEAEQTKWQAAKVVQESVKRVGGNILGVVLNKRRFYIPDFIYKYL